MALRNIPPGLMRVIVGKTFRSYEAISTESREYERTSTTVMNAYVLPVVKNYIEHLPY
jgi:N-methylhydantoinase A/oxoprolinase/acetone carboxylase beta subunit